MHITPEARHAIGVVRGFMSKHSLRAFCQTSQPSVQLFKTADDGDIEVAVVTLDDATLRAMAERIERAELGERGWRAGSEIARAKWIDTNVALLRAALEPEPTPCA